MKTLINKFSILLLLAVTTGAVTLNAITHSVNTNADAVPTPPIGSLRWACNIAAAGDTIEFSIPNTQTITLTSQIVINKDLTIIGDGHTISGNNTSRMFFFNNTNILNFYVVANIYNLNFINGLSSSDGGGAIHSSRSILTAINCNFIENRSIINYSGGAMAIRNNSTAIIKHCNFIGNNAHTFGGAIVSESVTLMIDSCSFINNSGTNPGGAIFIQGNYYPSTTTITNCLFENNTASLTNGGAIYIGYGNPSCIVDISNCTFENNNSLRGGAIFMEYGSTATVDSCKLENNTATTNGGGIFISGGSVLDLKDSRIGFNSAGGKGGGLYIGTGNNTVFDNGNVWYNNTATEAGGAYYIEP
jgi:predicted outer membrane repeat protein